MKHYTHTVVVPDPSELIQRLLAHGEAAWLEPRGAGCAVMVTPRAAMALPNEGWRKEGSHTPIDIYTEIDCRTDEAAAYRDVVLTDEHIEELYALLINKILYFSHGII
jgi:hypothetical protein